jgi:hypothetical protein
MRPLKKILCISFVLLAASIIPSSFAWDGLMAMDADKRNVKSGQIITYEGYLYGDYPIDDEIISITVLDKDTKKIILTANSIPGIKAVEVDTLYEEFEAGKTYVVEAVYDDKSTKLEFFIQPGPEPTCLDLLRGDDVLVFTDKEKYDQGDTIRVSGCLSERAFTKGITIAVYDPLGDKIGTSTLVPNSDRTFSEDFIINEEFGVEGTYFVEVDAGGLYSSTKSFVVPEFGAVALVVMIVSVAAVVLMSSKYTKVIHKF